MDARRHGARFPGEVLERIFLPGSFNEVPPE